LFVLQIVAMAHVKSAARYVGSAAGGGSGGKCHESGGSERIESVRLSDVGSHSRADDAAD
jgi:hypothetical protein